MVMKTAASPGASPDVMVAVMGATGTGKSTFINQLTADARIHISHNPESETSDIQTARYVDTKTGRSVVLIDTPGFDDSREGVTDMDILEKIVRFLEPAKGERRMLNGIIYMHRISDPRIGGVSRKNLRMFHSLCGEDSLENVLIVTTNWGRVGKEEGDNREEALRTGAFKNLISAKAGMRRHLNTVESARAIISGLIPLKAVTMQIQQELERGVKLGDTAAGNVLTEEMRAMQKKHGQELANLKKEMDSAAKASDLALRAELAKERSALERKMARAEEDRQRMSRTLEQTRKDLVAEQAKFHALQRRTEEQSIALKRLQDETEKERKRLADQMKDAEEKRRKLEVEQREAMQRNKILMEQLETERRERREEANRQAVALANTQAKMAKETERLAAEIKAGEQRRNRLEAEQREAKRRNDNLMGQLTEDRRKQFEEARKYSEALREAQLKIKEYADCLISHPKPDAMVMRTVADQDTSPDVMVAVIGPTGVGKSTFINQVTSDARIRIGYGREPETFDIQTARYVDKATGRSVVLIDTPGFDDSRDGVTDTDILEKIVGFLEPAGGERWTLNGIIYMHRISDPRVGGVSRKNLRMLRFLCGDNDLRNVCIVTTHWGRVGKEEGDNREEALRTGAFKALLDTKASMRRHFNTMESARAIVSGLIPLKAVG